jgi:cyanophycin synthetase
MDSSMPSFLCIIRFMELASEPTIHQGACSYCGDAPVNHRLYYLENLLSSTADSTVGRIARHAPRFLERFADLIPIFLFRTLSAFGLAHLSSDIEKANSFRSRLIWEEASRRGIDMKQVWIGKRPLDLYRAVIHGKVYYFESIPIQPEFLTFKKDWDNKLILKKELSKHGIPVPRHQGIPFIRTKSLDRIFSELALPVIVKPQLGSRGRHTLTNITTYADFKEAVAIAGQIASTLVVEEHLHGSVCRATLVGGTLAGFYKGQAPAITGDGVRTIRMLIEEKDGERNARIMPVRLGKELYAHIARSGFDIDDILPEGIILVLTHRNGRLFGGTTREMINSLHPSFVPIFERAATITGLSVVGFDAIIPDPTKEESSQRWGIIEANTLPFIDLHYYALEGAPRNIAGMIWDLWDRKPNER